jgi:hypothetical protein
VSLLAKMRGPLPFRAWTSAALDFNGDEIVIQPGLMGRAFVSARRLKPAAVAEIVRPPALGRAGFIAIHLRSGERIELQLGQADELVQEFGSHGYSVG